MFFLGYFKNIKTSGNLRLNQSKLFIIPYFLWKTIYKFKIYLICLSYMNKYLYSDKLRHFQILLILSLEPISKCFTISLN